MLIALVDTLIADVCRSLNAFYVDQTGATLIEYGLLALLVALAAFGILGTLGVTIADVFPPLADALGE
ncbi:MAG: Flp family type IVb pilin [Geminicoccaceae bacterium]